MKKEHTDMDALRAEIEAAERRVAREIEPGPRAFVVAILVFVLLGSFILLHTGAVRGWDVLFSSHGAGAERGRAVYNRHLGRECQCERSCSIADRPQTISYAGGNSRNPG